jgi:hypothetical protein
MVDSDIIYGSNQVVWQNFVDMAAVLDEVGKSEEKLVDDGHIDDIDDIEVENGATEASKKKKRKKKKKKAGKNWDDLGYMLDNVFQV